MKDLMDQVDCIELLEFQDKLTHKERDEQWKILYMWVKQSRIGQKMFLALSEWILLRESEGIMEERKKQYDLDGEW